MNNKTNNGIDGLIDTREEAAKLGGFFNNVLNSIADPVFVKDDEYKFVFANNALCEMLGMKRENIIGKTLGESLPADQMKHFLEVDKMVFESGQENVSEEPLTEHSGKILTIITKKTRYVDEQGRKFLVGVIRDISEHKELERQLSEKVAELERFNKLMVDRELKLIELKEELKKYKDASVL